MRHLHALFDGGFVLGDAAAGEGQDEGEGGYVEVGFSYWLYERV